jgi:hypothetical protein
MREFSTNEERQLLLQRLNNAPSTEEIRIAIRIVEEAMDYAVLRESVIKIFSSPKCPQTFEEIVESGIVHNEMRVFCNAIDEMHRDMKLEKFKDFYLPKQAIKTSQDVYDEDGFLIISS